MKQENKKNGKINCIGIITILIGLLLICIFIAIHISIDEPGKLWEFIYSFAMNVGMTIVTIGAGTVLYGYFDFVNYMRNNLREVILEYSFIKNLNDDQKELLMNKISKDLVYHDENIQNDTLYSFVNKEVKELTQSPYYEKLDLSISCRYHDGKIYKSIIRKFIINYENAKSEYLFDLKRITKTSFVYNSQIDKPISVTKLTLNNHDLTDKIEFQEKTQPKFNQYSTECFYTFKEDFEFRQENYLINEKKILKIELEYHTCVPEDDNTMGFRVYAPCRFFEASFVYDESITSVFCDAFAFKDRKPNQSKIDNERIDYTRNDNNIIVKMGDWILPGDGVIYVITPKGRGKND